MSYMMVRDNALWVKHIEGDPVLVERILAMPQNAPIELLIDGYPVRFVKMRDGRDGRPTPGLRPADAEAKRFWDALQHRRGEGISVGQPDPSDPPSFEPAQHLSSLSALLSEWDSPEDAAAYDRL